MSLAFGPEGRFQDPASAAAIATSSDPLQRRAVSLPAGTALLRPRFTFTDGEDLLHKLDLSHRPITFPTAAIG